MSKAIEFELDPNDEVHRINASGTYTRGTVKVAELTVDLNVQRSSLNSSKVNRIVRDFDPNAVGEITVSDRGLGEKITLDGQHRVEAIRRISSNTGTVDARIFTGLTRDQEARLFLLLNYANQPSLADKYRVGVTGRVREYMEIDKIAHHVGFTVGDDGKVGTIGTIASLVRIYGLNYRWEDEDEDAQHTILLETLKLIRNAWGVDQWGLTAAPLEGVARMLQRYHQLDMDRLLDTMRSTPGGPQNLVARARGYATSRGIRQWQALGQLLVDEYNKHLANRSAKRLEAFASR